MLSPDTNKKLNFWQKLNKPFTVLAPMDDVTDVVFRDIVAEVARPDVFFTEFTNCDALCSQGRETQIRRLLYTEKQRPIVAQIWGPHPETYYKTAQLVSDMGFDGIDINMGCPQRPIIKNNSGAALIKDKKLTTELIMAVKEGAPNIPLSVKTRIGFNSVQTEEWLGFLLGHKLDCLIVHGRTAKELSKVPAHWDEIKKAVLLRNNISKDTIMVGNGDVKDYADAAFKSQEYLVDGVMIGRGIFENIKAFDKNPGSLPLSKQESLKLLVRHCELFFEAWGRNKNFSILKKFFKIYVKGFNGANDLRIELMDAENLEEIKLIVSRHL